MAEAPGFEKVPTITKLFVSFKAPPEALTTVLFAVNPGKKATEVASASEAHNATIAPMNKIGFLIYLGDEINRGTETFLLSTRSLLGKGATN